MTLHPHLEDFVRGVSQAIEGQRWDEAAAGVRVLFDLVDTIADHMDHLAQAAGEASGDTTVAFRDELEAVYGTYVRIFQAAMAPGVDRSVIGTALYVPWGVAQRALRRNMPSLANRFLAGSREGLTELVSRLDPEGRAFAADRLTRYPKEFLTLSLPRSLSEGIDPELATAVQLARSSLGYLAQLAKRAIDRRDIESFVQIVRTMGSVNQSDVRRSRLAPSEDRGRWKAAQQLHVSTNAVLLGITGWIMRCRREDESYDFDAWLHALALHVSCRHLVLGFEDAQAFETHDAMGWDWWFLEGSEGEVVRIDLRSLLDLAFLEMLSRCDVQVELFYPDEPAAVRELQHHFEDERLGRALREGLEGGVFSDTVAGAEDLVRERLTSIRDTLNQTWSTIVIESPMSPPRVHRFRESVAAGWESGRALRHIFDHFGRLAERNESAESYRQDQWRGINTLLDKEYFVEGSKVDTSYLAEQYGKSILQGQENFVWNSISSGGTLRVTMELLLSTLRDLLEESPESFLLVGNWPEAIITIRRSPEFEFALDGPWEGDLWGHRVFHSWADRSTAPAAMICSPENLPTWVQWRPWLDGAMQGFHPYLKGRLRAIDERVAAELRFSGDRPSPEILRRKVHFEAYARSSIEIQDRSWTLLGPSEREASTAESVGDGDLV